MKYCLFIFLLFLPVLELFSQETIRVTFDSQSRLRWNEENSFWIRIHNRGSEPVVNLHIEIAPNGILTFYPAAALIETIPANDFKTVYFYISSQKRQYFSEEIPVKLTITAPDFVQERTLFILLAPAKYFWLITSFIIVIILAAVMAIIYIKLTKGEKQHDRQNS